MSWRHLIDLPTTREWSGDSVFEYAGAEQRPRCHLDEGELSEGFFEPQAATVTGPLGVVLRCGLPEGVRIPEWAIDTTNEPFELSKANVSTTLALPLDSAKRKLRARGLAAPLL